MSTDTQQINRALVQHVRIKASAERIYTSLTRADELERWFPTRAKTDPVLGGSLRYDFVRDDGSVHTIEGRYLELVPNRLVSYSWNDRYDGEQAMTNLTVTFRIEGDGDYTDLYLEETGYAATSRSEKLFGQRSGGWSFFFANIKSILEGGADDRGQHLCGTAKS